MENPRLYLVVLWLTVSIAMAVVALAPTDPISSSLCCCMSFIAGLFRYHFIKGKQQKHEQESTHSETESH